jgi:hypothetical protein
MEVSMRTILKLGLVASAAVIGVAPAIAGEITGNGTDIEINARSECAFSGRNDTPEGIPGLDPGGLVQSYGQFIALGWFDAQDFDPRTDFLKPGFACNPNRGADLHDGG